MTMNIPDTAKKESDMTTTVQITETVNPNYQERDGVMVDCSTTHAVILDEDGAEVADFGGPVSQEWLPAEWDAALADAGWHRVSDWDVSEGTAQVVTVADPLGG